MRSIHLTGLSVLQLRHVVEVLLEMSRFKSVDRDDRLRAQLFHEADNICRQHVTAGMDVVQAAVGVRQDVLS